jgi:hypothetical protein
MAKQARQVKENRKGRRRKLLELELLGLQLPKKGKLLLLEIKTSQCQAICHWQATCINHQDQG